MMTSGLSKLQSKLQIHFYHGNTVTSDEEEDDEEEEEEEDDND